MAEQNFNYAPCLQSQDRVKLNVGGKLFETTVSTLQSAGPDSLLYALSNRSNENPAFIDRDPEIFSVLLSILRSGHLPSTAHRFSPQELSDEALYYGVETQLRSAASPPPFSGIDASLATTIYPASDPIPTAFSAAGIGDGSILVAHGGQISAYDWNLTHTGTVRTHLEDIGSIRRAWAEVAAVASGVEIGSGSGLHFYDIAAGRHVGSVLWSDPSDPRVYKARVGSIADSADSCKLIFASFECPHRENSVLAVDKATLQVVSEIGRQSGTSAKTAVPVKLTHLPEHGLLFGSAINCGAFGFSGYVRLWDVRSRAMVWETNEPGSGRSSRFGDPFADVEADPAESAIFKVCSKSGDLAVADLRKLGEDPWVYLEEKNPSLRSSVDGGAGISVVLHCYRKQIFVSRESGLEVWSPVEDGNANFTANERFYRRNFVDKEEDSNRGVIKMMEGGGNRLFISREGVEGIEVWETSNLLKTQDV